MPLVFSPFVISRSDGSKVPVEILPANENDLLQTVEDGWQSGWNSSFLNQLDIEKYAMKSSNGELIALGAYQIAGSRAFVYIVYLESAPSSNPTMTKHDYRRYFGIGEVMIAFGIKYSIDNGCRGDVVFDAKTDELATHYKNDFHALEVSRLSTGGPRRFMLADIDAWNLFSKFLVEED